MLIRYGYEIAIICPTATPLVCMMSVQAERLQDLRKPEVATTTPFVPTATYHDGYGNLCRRLVAPAVPSQDWLKFEGGVISSL
jgi:hypothetical protein